MTGNGYEELSILSDFGCNGAQTSIDLYNEVIFIEQQRALVLHTLPG